MSEYKKNKDIFLQSIGNVKPLKKSNRNFKEINLSPIKTTKTVKAENKSNNITPKTKIPKTKIEDEVNKNNLNKESYLLKRKLRKGDVSIDRKVDFHGLSLEQAKRKFVKIIDECFYSNARCILFITGKGIKKSNYSTTHAKLFHGIIRENFQKWVLEKGVASKILSVTPAGFSHGGDGAFFVYLRKSKI